MSVCPKASIGESQVVFFASLITPLKKVATEFIMDQVYQKPHKIQGGAPAAPPLVFYVIDFL